MEKWLGLIGKSTLVILIMCALIGVMDTLDMEDPPILVFFIMVTFIIVSPFFIGKFIWSKGRSVLQHVSKEEERKNAMENEFKSIQNQMDEYNQAKYHFKYLSNDALLNKYNHFIESNIENMVRLALEEELVERNLISHSQMHDKLDAILDKLKG